MTLSDNQAELDEELRSLGVELEEKAPVVPRRKWTSVFFEDERGGA